MAVIVCGVVLIDWARARAKARTRARARAKVGQGLPSEWSLVAVIVCGVVLIDWVGRVTLHAPVVASAFTCDSRG